MMFGSVISVATFLILLSPNLCIASSSLIPLSAISAYVVLIAT